MTRRKFVHSHYSYRMHRAPLLRSLLSATAVFKFRQVHLTKNHVKGAAV